MEKNMAKKPIFKPINAKYFFENYATEVKTYKHKMRGVNNDKPIDFNDDDKRIINKGIDKLINELKKNKFSVN